MQEHVEAVMPGKINVDSGAGRAAAPVFVLPLATSKKGSKASQ